MQHIMVDGGAGVIVMLLSTFEKMGYQEKELMRTNTILSMFTKEVTNTRGVMSVELTVGSKMLATAFFVVDINRWYNLLVGHDWIHANGCVPSTLHQCLVQWVGDEAEIVYAEEQVCVAAAEARDEKQSRNVACLSGQDLSDYDYICVGRDGLVPVNVKPTNVGRLNQLGVS
jgi:hypothetical protein